MLSVYRELISTWQSVPYLHVDQAMRFCHSAKAAESFSLILFVDSSKLKALAVVFVCGFDRIERTIIDPNASEKMFENLRIAGLRSIEFAS